MPITSVTFTGADTWTNISALNHLFLRFPCFEVGILISPARAGLDARYPTRENILRLLDGINAPKALHLCGQAAKAFLVDGAGSDIISGLVSHPAVGRIQVNTNARKANWLPDISTINAHVEAFERPVILQQHGGNTDLLDDLAAANLQILCDASGGRGIRPESWPAPVRGRRFGYAGGIGPDTILGDLKAISDAAGQAEVWIDMEGRVRTDDLLDLSKVERILSAFASFKGEAASIQESAS